MILHDQVDSSQFLEAETETETEAVTVAVTETVTVAVTETVTVCRGYRTCDTDLNSHPTPPTPKQSGPHVL